MNLPGTAFVRIALQKHGEEGLSPKAIEGRTSAAHPRQPGLFLVDLYPGFDRLEIVLL